MKCPDWDPSHHLKKRWSAQLKMLRSVAVSEVKQLLSVSRCCPRALSSSAQQMCGDQAAELHPAEKGAGRRFFLWLCSEHCIPWELCETLHGDEHLVIWGLDGKKAAPATPHPRALNCHRRRVVIERGKCFLINYVNPAAAGPSCIFSNILSFVAQLLSVLWATANLKKLVLLSCGFRFRTNNIARFKNNKKNLNTPCSQQQNRRKPCPHNALGISLYSSNSEPAYASHFFTVTEKLEIGMCFFIN